MAKRLRYLIADDWTHLNSMDEEYDLRWVIDRKADGGYGELVAAEYATAGTGRRPGWRMIDTSAHWDDIRDHLLTGNNLPADYKAHGDVLRLSDELPGWAVAQVYPAR